MLNLFIGLVIGAFIGWVIPAPGWATRLITKAKG